MRTFFLGALAGSVAAWIAWKYLAARGGLVETALREELRSQLRSQVPQEVQRSLRQELSSYGITEATGRQISSLLSRAESMRLI